MCHVLHAGTWVEVSEWSAHVRESWSYQAVSDVVQALRRAEGKAK